MSIVISPGKYHLSLPVLAAVGIVSVALLMVSTLCLAQIRWAADGVEVCDEAANQRYPRIAPDGTGGAIITWEDERGGNQDIYAQRVDSGGTPLWDADGMPVSTAAGSQCDQRLVSDGAGGTIITWEDERGGDWDVYAQKVSDYAQEWHLAEGSTGTNEYGSFETWVLVQNPGGTEADVQLYYQTPDEEIEGHHLTLNPHTRQTVNVSDFVPDEFSVSTRVVSDTPVIAERAMYWTSAGGVYRQAGHDSIGFTMR